MLLYDGNKYYTAFSSIHTKRFLNTTQILWLQKSSNNSWNDKN